jgi:hypothetical protein
LFWVQTNDCGGLLELGLAGIQPENIFVHGDTHFFKSDGIGGAVKVGARDRERGAKQSANGDDKGMVRNPNAHETVGSLNIGVEDDALGVGRHDRDGIGQENAKNLSNPSRDPEKVYCALHRREHQCQRHIFGPLLERKDSLESSDIAINATDAVDGFGGEDEQAAGFCGALHQPERVWMGEEGVAGDSHLSALPFVT